MTRKNVRAVLPGDYVLIDNQPALAPQKVHHVEILSGGPGIEVAICLSPGPHPRREVDKQAPWPIAWRGIGDTIEVVPEPPKVSVRWDVATQKWISSVGGVDVTA